jgi:hypothetical protein
MDDKDSHGPIEEDFIEQMRALGQALDMTFNPEEKSSGNGKVKKRERDVGFCLLTFKFGDVSNKSRMNYISNSNRADMILALEEFIDNNKRQRNKPQTNDRRKVDLDYPARAPERRK